MTTISAKQLTNAAASIRGAQAAGVRTLVADAFISAAPEMVAAAAAEIRRIDDLSADDITDALHCRMVQLRHALAEFCAVTGLVDPIAAEIAASQAVWAAEIAAREAAEVAAAEAEAAQVEAERLAAWDESAEAETILSMAGERLAWVEVNPTRYRSGQIIFGTDEVALTTRDGRILARGELYICRANRLDAIDGEGWATYRIGDDQPVETRQSDVPASDWMPANARPEQRSQWDRIGYDSDYDAERVWDAARAERAEQRAQERAAKTEAQAPKPATLADLAAALGGKRKRL